MSKPQPVAAQTQAEDDIVVANATINELTSSLYTSNVTMIVAIILLFGVALLCIFILIRFRHIPTRANVDYMIGEHPAVKSKKENATLGGVSFW